MLQFDAKSNMTLLWHRLLVPWL